MKMVVIRKNGHLIYKHVPDDWKPEDEKYKDITGDLTTSGRKSIGFTDIPDDRWNKIFKKDKK